MIKFIFFPFALFWAVFMRIRRNFYKNGRKTAFEKSVISVGNLCMGGSGKTPHVEYLINLLKKNHFHTAILSRGYKRKTKGFRLVDDSSSSKDVGDEPLLFYKKHKDVSIAVCKNRIEGVNKIMEIVPETNVIILDDAYQYMPLQAGLSILLSDYYKQYTDDYVVPVGHLREGRSAAKDADIIIITKSPKIIPSMEEKIILDKITPLPHQKVYFSYIDYSDIIPLNLEAEKVPINDIKSAVAVCGIANPYPFLEYIDKNFQEKQHIVFSDHHLFTARDIERIRKYFYRSMQKNCAVITTKKDAMRLMDSEWKKEIEDLPIFYLPIEVKFHHKYKDEFEEQILEYVRKSTECS
jgi:tetraacyldisaccharide 4'-kinase